jgi:hypothetical protein
MIDLTRIDSQVLSTDPYRWAFIGDLFPPSDAAALVEAYPEDSFKTLVGSDGEKGWEYEVRSLIHMGAAVPSDAKNLSREWQQLADDLLSQGYREAVGRLTEHDLSASPIEVNVFHYGRVHGWARIAISRTRSSLTSCTSTRIGMRTPVAV